MSGVDYALPGDAVPDLLTVGVCLMVYFNPIKSITKNQTALKASLSGASEALYRANLWDHEPFISLLGNKKLGFALENKECLGKYFAYNIVLKYITPTMDGW